MDFRLRDFRYPFVIFKIKNDLDKMQWATASELRSKQEVLLGSLIRHCYEMVPYYSRLFERLGITPDDITCLDDLKKIPILTKQDVRDNYQKLIALNYKDLSPVAYKTGGTTGTPLEFLVDKHANSMEFATVWRHWNWAGYRFGDKFCDLRGKIIKGDKPYMYDWRLNAMFLSSYRMTRGLVETYAAQLRRFNPRIIRGYPSAINMFATFLRESNIRDIRPVSVVTSSETLLPHQRRNIEDAFGCKVFDTYGLEERSAAAGQCSEGGMHVDSEYGIIRILDEHGVDVPVGQEGEFVCTGLHNYVMPLINYRTNDLGAMESKTCTCGRELPLLKYIKGRVEDMVCTPDGRHVAGSGLSVAFKHSLGIKMSQIIQQNINEMTVRIVKADFYTDQDQLTLINSLRDRVGDEIKINIEYVDNIPLTRGGKLKFVVSELRAN